VHQAHNGVNVFIEWNTPMSREGELEEEQREKRDDVPSAKTQRPGGGSSGKGKFFYINERYGQQESYLTFEFAICCSSIQ